MELKFHIREPGEYTSYYDVAFEGSFTVRELLEHILKGRGTSEYGFFDVNHVSQYRKGKHRICEYKRGELVWVNEELFGQYSEKEVTGIRADGGWYRMDYIVYTEDIEVVRLREQAETLGHMLDCANDRIRGLVEIAQEKESEVKALKLENSELRQENEKLRNRGLVDLILRKG